MRGRLLSNLILGLAGLCLAAPAPAQDFPIKPVHIIVPYPAGGGVDGLARPLAEELSKMWGQPVLVENKPGASTMIGGDYVAKAPADGYRLFFTSDSSITSNPHLYKNMSFDPVKDLAPVTQLIDLHQMVVVHPSVSANTMQELVALAKAKPDTLNYGSYGSGSQPNLVFEALKSETGIKMTHVPYKGIAPALTATISGEVQMTLGGAGTSTGYISAGKLKPLAIARKERLKLYPDVPTLRESGFPGIDPQSWFGMFAPAGTPRATVDKIQKAVAAVFAKPDFDEKHVTGKGYTGVANAPGEFADFIKSDLAYKARLIEISGAKAE
jgi:tripartite-type tricarboxylate transporter receptor subunit TctC